MGLKEWMDDRDLTAKEVADDLGVSVQAVYGWLSGAFVPTTHRLIELHQMSEGKIDIGTFAMGEQRA